MRRIWLGIVVTAMLAARASGSTESIRAVPPAGSAPPTPHLKLFGAALAPQVRAAGAATLDAALAEISRRYVGMAADHPLGALHATNPAARFRLAAPLAIPEVLIDAVTIGDPQLLKNALQILGLRDVAVFSNDVSGWLPVDQIAQISALTELRYARASMPRTRAGPVATQGDFAQRSAAIRASYPSLTGAGITVGVLSDSFNCYHTYAQDGVSASGFNGYAANGFTASYAQDQLSGALPAGIRVLAEASCLSYGAPERLPFTDEGRAILQIIHAVAPGAGLDFYTAENGEASFATGIIQLAADGARIIDDDIGYFDEPFFQDGLVAQAIDQVSARGVAYFSSAGNNGRVAYENVAPKFPVVASSAPNTGEQLLNFDTSGATTASSLPVTIPALLPGEFVALIVQWDQPYITGAAASGGAISSLDLCVMGVGADQIDGASPCSGPNASGVDPVRLLIIGNAADAAGATAAESVSISIGLANGSRAPGRIKFVLDGDGAAVSIGAFATDSSTIQGHPNAAGAMAVGAAYFLQTPQCGTSPALLESFSSAGGGPILFDVTGARLPAAQVRQKPELVGPDGVNDTFLGHLHRSGSAISGCEDDASLPNFFGTSAAAPHAAAAAALMMQANPALSASQIDTALESSALAMGTVPNDDSGYGLVQADAALSLLPPAPPTISVSPSSVMLGTSATLSWSSISTTSCRASGSWSGMQSTSGSQSISPSASGANTYTLTCAGAGGSNSASVVLTATAPASSSGGGGGGSLDEIGLLVLAAALLLRRRPHAGASA